MSWTAVEQLSHLEAYQAVLDREVVYADSAIGGLRGMLDRGAELWLFDNGSFQIALGMRLRDSTGQVVNAVPCGDCSGEQSCREVIQQVRRVVDRWGVTSFQAAVSLRYETTQMQQLLAEVPRMIWEFCGVDQSNPKKRVYLFERPAVGRVADAEFVGPAWR